ncbi:MAG: DedA family protein [Oscillatoriales cyanobacterium RM2_1_1]|nr:DedA family protein [Oscillatoriales cyanobacterium RM2_1_1]
MLDWVTQTIQSLGYVGIAFLMFLENYFSPIPSEIIMPLGGFTASRGELQVLYVVLAGVLGSILGALPWYYLGKLVKKEQLMDLADRYGRWLTVSGEDIEKAQQWFDRRGQWAVLICRVVPGIRTYISLPAGMSHMPLMAFLIYSTIGTFIWIIFLTYAGYGLGKNYTLVEKFISPIAILVIASLAIAVIVWITIRSRNRK